MFTFHRTEFSTDIFTASSWAPALSMHMCWSATPTGKASGAWQTFAWLRRPAGGVSEWNRGVCKHCITRARAWHFAQDRRPRERVPHTPPTLGKEPRVGCGVGRWLFGSKEQLSCQQTEFSEYDKMVITDVKIRVAFSANSMGSLSNLIFESPRN